MCVHIVFIIFYVHNHIVYCMCVQMVSYAYMCFSYRYFVLELLLRQ